MMTVYQSFPCPFFHVTPGFALAAVDLEIKKCNYSRGDLDVSRAFPT